MNKVGNKTFKESIEEHIDIFFKQHGYDMPESGLHQRVIAEVEKVLIAKTLSHTNSVHSKAADILGINRNTLRKKIKDLNL